MSPTLNLGYSTLDDWRRDQSAPNISYCAAFDATSSNRVGGNSGATAASAQACGAVCGSSSGSSQRRSQQQQRTCKVIDQYGVDAGACALPPLLGGAAPTLGPLCSAALHRIVLPDGIGVVGHYALYTTLTLRKVPLPNGLSFSSLQAQVVVVVSLSCPWMLAISRTPASNTDGTTGTTNTAYRYSLAGAATFQQAPGGGRSSQVTPLELAITTAAWDGADMPEPPPNLAAEVASAAGEAPDPEPAVEVAAAVAHANRTRLASCATLTAPLPSSALVVHSSPAAGGGMPDLQEQECAVGSGLTVALQLQLVRLPASQAGSTTAASSAGGGSSTRPQAPAGICLLAEAEEGPIQHYAAELRLPPSQRYKQVVATNAQAAARIAAAGAQAAAAVASAGEPASAAGAAGASASDGTAAGSPLTGHGMIQMAQTNSRDNDSAASGAGGPLHKSLQAANAAAPDPAAGAAKQEPAALPDPVFGASGNASAAAAAVAEAATADLLSSSDSLLGAMAGGWVVPSVFTHVVRGPALRVSLPTQLQQQGGEDTVSLPLPLLVAGLRLGGRGDGSSGGRVPLGGDGAVTLHGGSDVQDANTTWLPFPVSTQVSTRAQAGTVSGADATAGGSSSGGGSGSSLQELPTAELELQVQGYQLQAGGLIVGAPGAWLQPDCSRAQLRQLMDLVALRTNLPPENVSLACMPGGAEGQVAAVQQEFVSYDPLCGSAPATAPEPPSAYTRNRATSSGSSGSTAAPPLASPEGLAAAGSQAAAARQPALASAYGSWARLTLSVTVGNAAVLHLYRAALHELTDARYQQAAPGTAGTAAVPQAAASGAGVNGTGVPSPSSPPPPPRSWSVPGLCVQQPTSMQSHSLMSLHTRVDLGNGAWQVSTGPDGRPVASLTTTLAGSSGSTGAAAANPALLQPAAELQLTTDLEGYAALSRLLAGQQGIPPPSGGSAAACECDCSDQVHWLRTWVYVLLAIACMLLLALLTIGACYCRRRLKRSKAEAAVELISSPIGAPKGVPERHWDGLAAGALPHFTLISALQQTPQGSDAAQLVVGGSAEGGVQGTAVMLAMAEGDADATPRNTPTHGGGVAAATAAAAATPITPTSKANHKHTATQQQPTPILLRTATMPLLAGPPPASAPGHGPMLARAGAGGARVLSALAPDQVQPQVRAYASSRAAFVAAVPDRPSAGMGAGAGTDMHMHMAGRAVHRRAVSAQSLPQTHPSRLELVWEEPAEGAGAPAAAVALQGGSMMPSPPPAGGGVAPGGSARSVGGAIRYVSAVHVEVVRIGEEDHTTYTVRQQAAKQPGQQRQQGSGSSRRGRASSDGALLLSTSGDPGATSSGLQAGMDSTASSLTLQEQHTVKVLPLARPASSGNVLRTRSAMLPQAVPAAARSSASGSVLGSTSLGSEDPIPPLRRPSWSYEHHHTHNQLRTATSGLLSHSDSSAASGMAGDCGAAGSGSTTAHDATPTAGGGGAARVGSSRMRLSSVAALGQQVAADRGVRCAGLGGAEGEEEELEDGGPDDPFGGMQAVMLPLPPSQNNNGTTTTGMDFAASAALTWQQQPSGRDGAAAGAANGGGSMQGPATAVTRGSLVALRVALERIASRGLRPLTPPSPPPDPSYLSHYRLDDPGPEDSASGSLGAGLGTCAAGARLWPNVHNDHLELQPGWDAHIVTAAMLPCSGGGAPCNAGAAANHQAGAAANVAEMASIGSWWQQLQPGSAMDIWLGCNEEAGGSSDSIQKYARGAADALLPPAQAPSLSSSASAMATTSGPPPPNAATVALWGLPPYGGSNGAPASGPLGGPPLPNAATAALWGLQLHDSYDGVPGLSDGPPPPNTATTLLWGLPLQGSNGGARGLADGLLAANATAVALWGLPSDASRDSPALSLQAGPQATPQHLLHQQQRQQNSVSVTPVLGAAELQQATALQPAVARSPQGQPVQRSAGGPSARPGAFNEAKGDARERQPQPQPAARSASLRQLQQQPRARQGGTTGRAPSRSSSLPAPPSAMRPAGRASSVLPLPPPPPAIAAAAATATATPVPLGGRRVGGSSMRGGGQLPLDPLLGPAAAVAAGRSRASTQQVQTAASGPAAPSGPWPGASSSERRLP